MTCRLSPFPRLDFIHRPVLSRSSSGRVPEFFVAPSPRPRCNEAFQFTQSLLAQFHRTDALRRLELGNRAEYHAQRNLRRPILILERGPGVGVFRPVLAPKQRIADPLLR